MTAPVMVMSLASAPDMVPVSITMVCTPADRPLGTVKLNVTSPFESVAVELDAEPCLSSSMPMEAVVQAVMVASGSNSSRVTVTV